MLILLGFFKDFSSIVYFFVVLSASVAQVRAHAPRMMWRIENRWSRSRSRLTWSLWHLQTELQFLGSLRIQRMVRYGRAQFAHTSSLTSLSLNFQNAIQSSNKFYMRFQGQKGTFNHKSVGEQSL